MNLIERYAHRRFERAARSGDERLGMMGGIKWAMRYVFPDHWSFLLGEIALYSFIVLVGTGIFLTLYYIPGADQVIYHGSYPLLQGEQMSEAYRSVLNLSTTVPAGLLFRQVHHWAADVFIASIVLHVVRVFFTGAYRKPRDLNYFIGLTMLMLAILEGFAGYSLVDDLLSGMGLAIAYSVAMSIPFIGGQLATLIWGGPFPGSDTFLPRLEIVHVLLIPAALARADQRAPGDHHAPAPLPVPRSGPPRAQRRGNADVARLRAALSRAVARGRRRAVPARRPRPDQSDLAMGAVPPVPVRERRPAGLVHRLADRSPAADAQLGARDRRSYRDPEPVLGRRGVPAARVRRAIRLAGARAPDHGRHPAPRPARPARATVQSEPRSAPRS